MRCFFAICLFLFLAACDGGGGSEPIQYPEESSETLSSSIESSAESSSEMSSSAVESSSSIVSSSSISQSSSAIVESSSSVGAIPCKTETEDNCEYGILVDERDGQVYKTVKIGELWWMAENLNYAYLQPTSTLDSSSWCYNNSAEYCEKFGRLYLWSAAIDSAALISNTGKGFGYGYACSSLMEPKRCGPEALTRGVCPIGWHLPWQKEWFSLFEITGNTNRYLKSKNDWINGMGGTDNFGLNVLPSGYAETYKERVVFFMIGEITDFWTPDFDDDAQTAFFSEEDGFKIYGAQNAYSVRCVKNSLE